MGLVQDELEFRSVLSGFSAAALHRSGEPFTQPALTSDPSNPASYVSWAPMYSKADQATFGKTERRAGEVVRGLWVERDTGAVKAISLADTLKALYRDASVAGLSFLWANARLEEADADTPGSYEDGAFTGFKYAVPFIKFEEPA